MSLEATLILLDNSDWSRNGDYIPTRWEVQVECCNMIMLKKLDINAESCVGIVSMSGKTVDVLITPTSDQVKLLAALGSIKQEGRASLKNSILISQLALKHRTNKNQKQRLVIFIASPIQEEESALVALGKRLKKNSLAVDVINVGPQSEAHISKLQKFVDAANTTTNSQNNSSFLNIEPGVSIATDIIRHSLMFGSSGGQQHNQGDFAADNFELNDANNDPDLAMALRISLEEEKERQKREEEQKQQQQQQPNQQQPQQTQPLQTQIQQPANQEQPEDIEEEDLTEEELLRRAQELSLENDNQEEIQVSRNNQQIEEEQKKQTEINEITDAIQDRDFVNELLKNIPLSQDALNSILSSLPQQNKVEESNQNNGNAEKQIQEDPMQPTNQMETENISSNKQDIPDAQTQFTEILFPQKVEVVSTQIIPDTTQVAADIPQNQVHVSVDQQNQKPEEQQVIHLEGEEKSNQTQVVNEKQPAAQEAEQEPKVGSSSAKPEDKQE